jgi:hypothetical protein
MIRIASKHAQIARVIVLAIPVDVIDNLSWYKRPSKHVMHHNSVDWRISRGVCSSFSALLDRSYQVSVGTIFGNSPQQVTTAVKSMTASPAWVIFATHANALNRQSPRSRCLADRLRIHVHYIRNLCRCLPLRDQVENLRETLLTNSAGSWVFHTTLQSVRDTFSGRF